MKVFSSDYINKLVIEARNNQRLRKNRNIHSSFDEPCQRLFNAIEPDSYIRPHRHLDRDELLIAIQGLMAVIRFEDDGDIRGVELIGPGFIDHNISIGVEIFPGEWHTVLSLECGSVLLEVKEGPFNPNQPKEHAKWAPCEGSESAKDYQTYLIRKIHDMKIVNGY